MTYQETKKKPKDSEPHNSSRDMNEERTESYAGMTVNERLFVSKLMDDFDAAARRRERAQMISILVRVDLSEKEAARSVDSILATPQKYGY
jgi:hypothetical protein